MQHMVYWIGGVVGSTSSLSRYVVRFTYILNTRSFEFII